MKKCYGRSEYNEMEQAMGRSEMADVAWK